MENLFNTMAADTLPSYIIRPTAAKLLHVQVQLENVFHLAKLYIPVHIIKKWRFRQFHNRT